jgi:hypothetical protein
VATRYAARDLAIAINGSPAVQLTSFDQVGSSRSLIDATAFGDSWSTYVTGIQDGDEVNFTFAYDPAEQAHQDFIDAYNDAAGEVQTFTITHDTAGLDVDVSAIITALRRGGNLGDLLQMSGSLKVVDPGVVDNS